MKKCSSNNCYLRYHEQGGGLPVFKGRLLHHRQRGFGLFSSIARFVVPIGKKLIKTLAPQVISTVTSEVADVVGGKKSIKSALKSTGKNILSNSAQVIKKELIKKQSGGTLLNRKRKIKDLTGEKRKRKRLIDDIMS